MIHTSSICCLVLPDNFLGLIYLCVFTVWNCVPLGVFLQASQPLIKCYLDSSFVKLDSKQKGVC